MMDESTQTVERRKRHDFRAVLPDVCDTLKPFFDPANNWTGHSLEYMALRALTNGFPALTVQDRYLLLATVKQLMATGMLTRVLAKAR